MVQNSTLLTKRSISIKVSIAVLPRSNFGRSAPSRLLASFQFQFPGVHAQQRERSKKITPQSWHEA